MTPARRRFWIRALWRGAAFGLACGLALFLLGHAAVSIAGGTVAGNALPWLLALGVFAGVAGAVRRRL